MKRPPSSVLQDDDRLSVLALRFRGTRSDAERREIANDYAQTVERLIHSGCWREMPSFEGQLSDDWMPKAFFEYWSPGQGYA